MNSIEAAVLPLKSDAMDRAEQVAKLIIERVKQKLAECNNDLRQAAPYPSSNMNRVQYMAKYAEYQLFAHLTVWRKSSISFHEPNYVDVTPEREQKFIAEAREDAAFQYDRFVAKLVKKIGPVEQAELVGNHVWTHSLLHVVKTDATMETWKTQTIVNVSKLGKVFNQFPTRKVKS